MAIIATMQARSCHQRLTSSRLFWPGTSEDMGLPPVGLPRDRPKSVATRTRRARGSVALASIGLGGLRSGLGLRGLCGRRRRLILRSRGHALLELAHGLAERAR